MATVIVIAARQKYYDIKANGNDIDRTEKENIFGDEVSDFCRLFLKFCFVLTTTDAVPVTGNR